MVTAHVVRVVGSRARDARTETEIFRRVATEKAMWDLGDQERQAKLAELDERWGEGRCREIHYEFAEAGVDRCPYCGGPTTLPTSQASDT